MEKIENRDSQGRLIDWVIPEVDDDRYYYRVVINREQVYYASHEEEACMVLWELMQAREDWNLEEKIKELNN